MLQVGPKYNHMFLHKRHRGRETLHKPKRRRQCEGRGQEWSHKPRNASNQGQHLDFSPTKLISDCWPP